MVEEARTPQLPLRLSSKVERQQRPSSKVGHPPVQPHLLRALSSKVERGVPPPPGCVLPPSKQGILSPKEKSGMNERRRQEWTDLRDFFPSRRPLLCTVDHDVCVPPAW